MKILIFAIKSCSFLIFLSNKFEISKVYTIRLQRYKNWKVNVFMYCENQTTVNDFKTQVRTLNYLIEMRKIKYAV